MQRAPLVLTFIAPLLLGATAAQAESISLVAHLLGSTEVPGSQSDAFAEAQFTYDGTSHALQYYVNYDGVAPAKMDLHRPAAANEKAASAVNIPLSESPVSGTVQLTPAQAGDLLAGKMYLDIHSQKYPDGEIRGQIVRQ
jgi:hypothetical protein